LPEEFALYLKGAAAWHSRLTNDAVAAWKKLLELPAKERQNRSTWAAFMLARATVDESPKNALMYCEQVRSLASAGFADSLHLAAASYGWQARSGRNSRFRG